MNHVITRILILLKIISITPLLVITLFTFIDVFARYVFNSPILGSSEVIQYFMAMAVFSTLPMVTYKKEHISVTLMESINNRFLYIVRYFFVDFAVLLSFILISYVMYKQGLTYYSNGTSTLFRGLPLGYLCFFMSFFSLLSAASVFLKGLLFYLNKYDSVGGGEC